MTDDSQPSDKEKKNMTDLVKVAKRVTLDLGQVTTREQARELRDACPVLSSHFSSTDGLDEMASRGKNNYKFSRHYCEELGHDPDSCPLRHFSFRSGNSRRRDRRRERLPGARPPLM